jgi:integrase
MEFKKFKDPVTNRFKWKTDFTCDRVRHRPIADSKDELADIVDAIKRRARARQYGLPEDQADREVVTLSLLVEARKTDLDEKKKQKRRERAILDNFCETLGGSRDVTTIKTPHVREYVLALRLRGLQAATVNRYLNPVNSMFHKAETYFPQLENWKTPKMPFEETEDQDGRQRVITEEEQARLFYQLRAPAGLTGEKRPRREKPEEVRGRHTVADLLDTLLLTGLRKGEGRTITKDKIDWTIRTVPDPRTGMNMTVYGEVILTKTKTGKKRRVPLNRDAREILERRAAEAKSKWLFPNTAETRPISETVVYRILRRAARRAKVPYGMKAEYGFVIHDSRHTAATNMLHGGADLKTVGSILGHTSETMTMKYSHPDARSRAGAIASLERSKKGSKEEEVARIPTDDSG